MDKVLIIVNAKVKAEGKIIASPVTERMVRALTHAIEKDSPSLSIEVVTPPTLRLYSDSAISVQPQPIYCPLTIQLPPSVRFPAYSVFQACQDVKDLREWVAQKLGTKTNTDKNTLGDRWLPIIVQPDGIRFGQIIGEGEVPNAYQQPIELDFKNLSALKFLAKSLIERLDAPPSVYLLQFRLVKSEIVFDRLWPFPAAPAIASLVNPTANLYTLYWHCVQQQRLISV